MNNYFKYEIEDFVLDPYFRKWITNPTPELNDFWERQRQSCPDQKFKIDEAAFLVRSLDVVEPSVSDTRINHIWNRIAANLSAPPKRNIRFLLGVASMLIVLICSAFAFYYFTSNSTFKLPTYTASDVLEPKLVLSDGSSKVLSEGGSNIEVNDAAEVIVDRDTIRKEALESEQHALNSIVLPYGEQINLLLSDGTRVYLNAGTKFSFPSQFEGSKREVYLQGEAMFEVSENAKKPFIVHTKKMDITVSGTEFNVSAYEDDTYVQAVLLSGSVNVSRPGIISKKIRIEPGQSATIHETKGKIITREVNAEAYVAWTKGYLVFEGEEFANVLRKIERFYKQKIHVEDKTLLKRKFSGKLDIQEDIDIVLEHISFAAGLKIEKIQKNEITYKIKP